MAIFLNVSCLWCRQRERTHIFLVALFVIRGYLGLLRPSRSSSTLWSLLRGWSVSLLEYFVKNWTWCIVFEGWRVFSGNVNMAKDLRTSLVYQHTTAKKKRNEVDSRGQNLSGEDNTCLVDCLEIPWMIDCFCLFCFYMFELLLLIQKMTCFLSSKRKSQNCRHYRYIVRWHSCLVVNKNALLGFLSVCHVLFRGKTRSLGNIILWKAITVHEVRNDN